jgi:hypothetical protein
MGFSAEPFAVSLEQCDNVAGIPAAVVALRRARRADKSSSGAMCHLHEMDDHALGDCTASSRGVAGVDGVHQAAWMAAIKCLLTPLREVAPI